MTQSYDEPLSAELIGGPTQTRLNSEQVGLLMRGIDRPRIATRSQGGKQLSYVEAYDIKATLIRLFGFGGFSARVTESKIVSIREHASGTLGHVDNQGKAKTPQVIAQSTVELTVFGIGPQGQDAVYTETAIGANSGWDIGDVCDNAIKTASSDALKRCAIYLGDQFGLSLYRDGSTDPVVRWLFDPVQKDLLSEYVQKQIENPPTPDASTQQALNRSTGNA